MADAPEGPGGGPTTTDFDADMLRERYRREREKRLRADGIAQYTEINGEHTHFAQDPCVKPGFERSALTDEVDVLIIGGGIGGLLTGTRLRQLGVESIRYVEKAGDFGGTWYWNRYPGIACDVESYIYMPLLEEMAYVPREKYSRGAEIFAHCQAIARKYELYRDVCFRTAVTELRWDDGQLRWLVKTDRNDVINARFVCMSTGFLEKPKLPGIPGIETFRGKMFHTSRWDYRYTGGDASGKLTGLADKRVGIIGTGATAVQCVPHLGESAGHLYVFQRTPSTIDVRNNAPTDPQWAAGLEAGWQQQRMDNFQLLTTGGYAEEDAVSDGWTDILRLVQKLNAELPAGRTEPDMARVLETADFIKMEQIRRRVDSLVADPEVAETLKPYYRHVCKRPCFHDSYLQTFNRPSVTLVDTDGKGVDAVTEHGVTAGGRVYPLDCLIFATGFEVGTDYVRRAGYDIIGRGGLALSQKWRDGPRTFHGMHMHGFPNCYLMSLMHSGITVNFPYMLNEQAKHIAYIVSRALHMGVGFIEASEASENAWVEEVLRLGPNRPDFSGVCTPGYYNREGGGINPQETVYYGKPLEFVQIIRAWREAGDLQGMYWQ